MDIVGVLVNGLAKLKDKNVWIGILVSLFVFACVSIGIGLVSIILILAATALTPALTVYATIPAIILVILVSAFLILIASQIPTATLLSILDKKMGWLDALIASKRYIWNLALAVIGKSIAKLIIALAIPGLIVLAGIALITLAKIAPSLSGVINILLVVLFAIALPSLLIALILVFVFDILTFITEAVSFKEGLGLTAFLKALVIARQNPLEYGVTSLIAKIIIWVVEGVLTIIRIVGSFLLVIAGVIGMIGIGANALGSIWATMFSIARLGWEITLIIISIMVTTVLTMALQLSIYNAFTKPTPSGEMPKTTKVQTARAPTRTKTPSKKGTRVTRGQPRGLKKPKGKLSKKG